MNIPHSARDCRAAPNECRNTP